MTWSGGGRAAALACLSPNMHERTIIDSASRASSARWPTPQIESDSIVQPSPFPHHGPMAASTSWPSHFRPRQSAPSPATRNHPAGPARGGGARSGPHLGFEGDPDACRWPKGDARPPENRSTVGPGEVRRPARLTRKGAAGRRRPAPACSAARRRDLAISLSRCRAEKGASAFPPSKGPTPLHGGMRASRLFRPTARFHFQQPIN